MGLTKVEVEQLLQSMSDETDAFELCDGSKPVSLRFSDTKLHPSFIGKRKILGRVDVVYNNNNNNNNTNTKMAMQWHGAIVSEDTHSAILFVSEQLVMARKADEDARHNVVWSTILGFTLGGLLAWSLGRKQDTNTRAAVPSLAHA